MRTQNAIYTTTRTSSINVIRFAQIGLFAFLAAHLNLATGHAQKTRNSDVDMNTFFMPITELEPFMVKGEELSISVYARTGSDRRYGERFAASVAEVAYETIEKSTGHGLIIVGDKEDPHPLFLFREYIELYENGDLAPEMSESAEELKSMLEELAKLVKADEMEEETEDNDISLDFETIAKAFPLPLEGPGRTLYQIAWSEEFDQDKLEDRLRDLTVEDLENNQMEKYTWVFYLPPSNSFKKVLKEILPQALKEAELGFFKRAAIRGAIVTFKPLIKDAVEGLRKGALYYTILRSIGGYSNEEIGTLTEAYVESIMPRGRILPGNKQERAIEAIEKKKVEMVEYAKDPFIQLERLESYEHSSYKDFLGQYGNEGHMIHFFTFENDKYHWQRKDEEIYAFYPASKHQFVSEDGNISIEFLLGEDGQPTEAKVKWDRKKYIVPKV